ncbi:MAG: hypothetical protein ACRCXG_16365 [Vibrio sp.]
MFNDAKGFQPVDIQTMMANYYQAHVKEWADSSLTEDRFRGSKEYELYYTAAQVDAQQQAFYAQTFERIKDYITLKNEKIQRPTPINDRIIQHFFDKYGFKCSVRATTMETRGILAICLDYTSDGSVLDQSIANDIIKYCAVGGVWTDGTISKLAPLSNGQSFEIKWSIPTEKTVEFKYTIIRSRNSNISELPAIDIRKLFLENFESRNDLGLDIEPQKYLTKSDLPWASSIVGERKIQGEPDFTSNVYKSEYTDKFTATLNVENIIVVDA